MVGYLSGSSLPLPYATVAGKAFVVGNEDKAMTGSVVEMANVGCMSESDALAARYHMPQKSKLTDRQLRDVVVRVEVSHPDWLLANKGGLTDLDATVNQPLMLVIIRANRCNRLR